METSFEINKVEWFTPKLVEEIENFEKDQYGNTWYNVLFEGDAETFMWLAKNKPEIGKKYWGHVEPTKSGKRLRFKTDKQEETAVPKEAASNYETVDKQASINRSVALNNAVLLVAGRPELEQGDVLDLADGFLGWLESREDKEDEPEEDYNRRTGNETLHQSAVMAASKRAKEIAQEIRDEPPIDDDPRYQ